MDNLQALHQTKRRKALLITRAGSGLGSKNRVHDCQKAEDQFLQIAHAMPRSLPTDRTIQVSLQEAKPLQHEYANIVL